MVVEQSKFFSMLQPLTFGAFTFWSFCYWQAGGMSRAGAMLYVAWVTLHVASKHVVKCATCWGDATACGLLACLG